ncbi:MAG: carboxypeptidase-like regulatory domain-containing protein [Sediminibacterium sp.]
MKKKFLFVALVISLPVLIFGQAASIHGVVLDSLTNKPLSGVSVSISNNKGTITDNKGLFSLTSQLFSKGRESKLSVSYVGYRPIVVPVLSTGEAIEIRMAPIHKELPEVILSSKTKSIVERAVEKIPENYPINPIIIKGLMRVNVSVNDTDYFYKSDAIAQVYAQSYKNGINQRVEVLQNKTTTIKNPRSDFSYVAPVSFVGNFSTIADVVYNKDFFLNGSSIDDYIYFQHTKTLVNGRVTYVIEFEKKRNNKIEGVVYIDSASLAFVKLNVKQYKVKSFLFLTRDFVSIDVNYRLHGSRWIINDSYQESIYDNDVRLKGREYVGFAANDYDTTDVRKISTFSATGSLDLDDKVQRFVDDSTWRSKELLFTKAESENKLSVIELPDIDTTAQPRPIGFAVRILKYVTNDNIRFRLYGVQLPYSLVNSSYNSVAAYGIGFSSLFRIYKPLFFQTNNEHNYGWGGLRTRRVSYLLNYQWVLNSKSNHSIVIAPFFGYSKMVVKDRGKNLEQHFSNLVAGSTFSFPVRKGLQAFAETEFIRSIKNHPATLSIQPNSTAIRLGVELRF